MTCSDETWGDPLGCHFLIDTHAGASAIADLGAAERFARKPLAAPRDLPDGYAASILLAG